MDLDGVELLSETDCRRLLAQGQVGRVAIALGELAVVFPVNYLLAGDEILFWTAEGTKLRAALDCRTVSFEVDDLDPATESGWSVLAVGQARIRTEPTVIAGARAAGLHCWAEGDRSHLVAIEAETLTGRRVGPTVDLTRSERTAGPMVGPHSPISALARPPLRVGRFWSLRTVGQAMHTAGRSQALVEGGQSVITRSDLTNALHAGVNPESPVGAVETTDGIVVHNQVTIIEAAERMLRGETRHVLVCDHAGQVNGLVGLPDVVQVLIDAMDPAVWVMLRPLLAGTHSGGWQEWTPAP